MGGYELGVAQAGRWHDEKTQQADQQATEQRQAKTNLLLQQYQNTEDPDQRKAIVSAFGALYPPEHAHHFWNDVKQFAEKLKPGQGAAPSVPSGTGANPGANVPAAGGVPPAVNKVAQAASPWDAIAQIPSAAQRATAGEASKEKAAMELQKEKGAENLEIAKTRAEASKQGRPVPDNNAAVALDDAMKLRDNASTQFLDSQGQDIDLEELKSSGVPLKLVPVMRPGADPYYIVANQKARIQVIGNQVITLPETGSTTTAQAASLGAKNLGHTSSSTTPGPAGPVTTTHQTTPITGHIPVSSNTPMPPTGANPQPSSNVSPISGATHPKTWHPSHDKMAEKASSGTIPPLRDTSLPPMRGADEQRIASVAAPMATVEQQVVGRGVKPLWEYSNVLNNPKMLNAVNMAMAAPMMQTPEGDKRVTFWGTVATALGLASAAQQVTTDMVTNARNRVQAQGGPEAVQFLDRLAELKGTIPNLRKIQGGSSAMGAMQPLYQESPIMNISSPEDFRNRTANMLRTMAVALDQTPGINKAHVNWIYQQADAAEGKKPAGPVSTKTSTAAPGAKPAGPPRPSNVPEGYVHKDNGPHGPGWYKQ
jgi:hypothetical protein